jgi:hypothetical protein
MVGALYECYIKHFPLYDVYLIHARFPKLPLLPSSGNCCHYTDRLAITVFILVLVETLRIQTGVD